MLEILSRILKRSADDLNHIGVRYACIGGLAVGARTTLRFTQDADLTIAVDSDQHAEAITGHLIRNGYQIIMELDHKPTGRIGVLRLRSPEATGHYENDELPLLDLLIHSTGIEHETVASAESVEMLSGLEIPTATVPYLIAMKVLSESDRRLQDRIDLQNLIAVATQDDLATVPGLLDLIDERGFANGKDLRSVFDRFVKEHHDYLGQ